MKHSNAFTMEHATILISLVCNLRCKLCSAFSPYHTDAKHPSEEHSKESLKRFFQIVSHVDKFTICGGEPLLYPYLTEILEFLHAYMPQIGLLEILTNGTIIPSPKLLDCMGRYEKDCFRVLVDDYGHDKSRRVNEIKEVLQKTGISHSIRNYKDENAHCGGWVDFGDLTEKKHDTQAQIEEKYSKCAYPNRLGFSFAIGPDGYMFPCGPARRCWELGLVDNYSEYINLYDDALSVDDQRKKMQKVLQGNSLEACAYCNGMCEDSPRFLPAEQLD